MMPLEVSVSIKADVLPENQDLVFHVVSPSVMEVTINKERLYTVLANKEQIVGTANTHLQKWIEKHLQAMAEREENLRRMK